jgi:glycosyltransferase involved in cell wall biosynthesis
MLRIWNESSYEFVIRSHRYKMTKSLVSILTPTFNHEPFIGECVKSVLNQTYKQWEMIIIDDGSTDGTPDIIRRYADPRICYVRNDHHGIERLGETYNQALSMAKGEFIVPLEGDDMIPPDRFEVQLPSFEDPGVVLSHGGYAYLYDKRMVVYPPLFGTRLLNNEPCGEILRLLLHGINPIGSQSVMIRKSSLLEIGGFVQPGYLPLVDYPTWMILALTGRFAFTPRVLGYWRRHPGSITMQQNEIIFRGFLKYCDEFIDSFRNELRSMALEPSVSNRGAIAHLALAWICLAKKQWRSASWLSIQSWERRASLDRRFRLKVGVTVMSAYLHLDIPNLLKKVKGSMYQCTVPS